MNQHTRKVLIDGPSGCLELAFDLPQGVPIKGLALIAHPHPLFGGTMDHKVVQTLARVWLRLGYLAVRFNFRGVGSSVGQYDEGRGEQEDANAVLRYLWQQPGYSELPLVLSGFSFGTFVMSNLHRQLQSEGVQVERMVLVGTPTSRWPVAPVPEDSLIIHGQRDDIIPLESVLEWAAPQRLPVVVVPEADHFFHGKLHVLQNIVLRFWGAR